MDVVERLRGLCLALPEVGERVSHGEACFFVRAKKLFVMFDSDHHGSGHLGFWCAAAPGAQEEMIAADAGVRLLAEGLDEPDWSEIDEIVRDAYRQIAPKILAAQLDG